VAREAVFVAGSNSTTTGTSMQALAYAMIITVLLVEYVYRKLHLPRFVALAPDMLSAIAALVVLTKLPVNRFRDIDARYLIIFGLLLFNFVAGAVLNDLQPGVIVAGVRKYFLAILFFLVPVVVRYDDRSLRKQLLLIAAICLIQFPLAFSQRLVHDAVESDASGDSVYGTLMNSSALSIFLCGVASVVMGLYLRGRLRLRTMVLFLAATLPATMINETKATLLLMPIAFLAPVFLAGSGSFRVTLKRAALSGLLAAAFLAVFIPVYDHYIKERWGYGLIEFFQMEGRVEGYLNRGVEVGSEKKAARIDTIVLPIKSAGADVPRMAFGLGMGNVSDSALGQGFVGEEYVRYGDYVGPNLSLLLWETGILGVALVLWLLYRIFKESLVARRADGLSGAFAIGWCGVVLLMLASMVYKGTIQSNALSYVFWFYSGLISATAMRVRRSSNSVTRSGAGVASAPRIGQSRPRTAMSPKKNPAVARRPAFDQSSGARRLT
jgi:hypothetical protein